MAAVCYDGNGYRRIVFVNREGARKSIRLGKVTDKQANAIRVKVEGLIGGIISGVVDDEVSRWLAAIPDALHEKLAAVGLVASRTGSRLEAWLDKYLDAKSGLKPESLRKLGQTKAKLLAFFDADPPIRAITPDQAADWRTWLTKQGMSEASVKTHCGNAKSFFNEAVERELIGRSPFRHLVSGNTSSKVTHYVTPEVIAKVIDAAPDHRWKLLFGLARYAGLRAPSETHLLTWANVDWTGKRLTVRSPKTERFEGHAARVVPIDPRLMKLLRAAHDELGPDGADRLVNIRGKGAMMRKVAAICATAGVKVWPRLWQTLRSSCEKEWADAGHPQYAVSRWIGHSILVSGKHYANAATDKAFEAAAAGGPAARIAAQQPSETPREASKPAGAANSENDATPADRKGLRQSAEDCQDVEKWSRGELNPRPEISDESPLHAYPSF